MADTDFLTEDETAELLKLAPSTLAGWRSRRRYDLEWIKVGRCVRYRRAQVEDFCRRRTVGKSTASGAR